MQRGTPNANDERIARQEELMKKVSNKLMSTRVDETGSETGLPLAAAKGTSQKEELEPSCTDTVGVHEPSMKKIEELEAALKKSYEKNRIECKRARKLRAQTRKDRRASKSNGYLVEDDSDDEDSNNATLLQYYEEQIQLMKEELDVLRKKEGTWKGYEKERAAYRQLTFCLTVREAARFFSKILARGAGLKYSKNKFAYRQLHDVPLEDLNDNFDDNPENEKVGTGLRMANIERLAAPIRSLKDHGNQTAHMVFAEVLTDAYNHLRSSILEIGESIEDEVLKENYQVNVR
ncbi:MAG: hypothetical protein SGARI_000524, partial [Bacillariaceae sp.]